jgi:uncharacterized membrane protein
MLSDPTAIISAVAAAVIYAVGGYLKSTKETFDYEKLISTIILGAAIGVISYTVGVTYDTATQLLTSAGLVATIEVWAKAIYRRLKTYLEPETPPS